MHAIVGELMYAEQLLHRALRRGAAADQLALLRRRARPRRSRPEPVGCVRRGRCARGPPPTCCGPGEPQLIPHERMLELIEQGEIELVGVATEDSSWLGVPAQGRGPDGRRPRRPVVHERTPVHRAGQGPARVRRPARRRRALPRARDRGDPAAERRARADQQRPGGARRRARAAGDLRHRRRQDPGGLRRPGRRHRHLRRGVGPAPLPVHDRARRPLPRRADRADRLPQARDGDARAADDRREHAGGGRAVRQPAVLSGEPAKSALFVPLVAGGQATGVISLQNLDREHAFSDADQRLLTTLAGSLSVALENARLVHETRQRNAELALINSVQAGARRRARAAGDLRPRRRQDPGDLRRPGRRHRHLRRGRGTDRTSRT